MNRLAQSLRLGIVMLVALISAGPVLIRLAGALVPLVLVVGILVIVWRVVTYLVRQ